eukprot:EG_transcript_3959
MGATLSADEVAAVPFLRRVADPSPLPLYDSPLFWSEGFASLGHLQLMLLDAEQLRLALGPALQCIYEHQRETRRYLQLFKGAAAAVEAASQGTVPPYLLNVLVILRTTIRHLIEASAGRPDEALLIHGDGRAAVQGLLAALVNFTSRVTLRAATFAAHAEVLTLLLVMCSTQLYVESVSPALGGAVGKFEGGGSPVSAPPEASSHVFLDALLGLPPATLQCFVLVLLHHYTTYCQAKGGPVDRSYLTSTLSLILSSLGKQAVTLALLPIYALRAVFGASSAAHSTSTAGKADGHPPPAGELVGRRSALLLLVLVFYRKNSPVPHAVLSAVSTFRNSYNPSTCNGDVEDQDCEAGLGLGTRQVSNTTLLHGVRGTYFEADYLRLYHALTRSCEDEEHPLLLYVLLHENPALREFTIHQENLSALLEPVLRCLYAVETKYVNSVYMQLIILLMLSQDGSFNSNIHLSVIPSVPWYRERCLTNISLGSLLVVVLIRVVQHNLQHTRDTYLSTNCLATLANMAPFFHQMHPFASQRLVFLLGMLTRRLLKLQAAAGSADLEEAEMYLEFLRNSLQCINACITHTLPGNLYLVYELIHQKLPLQPLAVYPKLADLVHNVQKVLQHFEEQISSRIVSSEEQDFSIADILRLLAEGLEGWKGDGLKVFNETKFKYEEEANPEEFFIPYVWDLVVFHVNRHPARLWDPASLPLLADATFSLATDAAPAEAEPPSEVQYATSIAMEGTVQV